MRKLLSLCLFSGIAFTSATAQTIFTYGGKPVSKTEFLRVYQKNAKNQRVDYSDSALRDYVNLYSLFRMKVEEAEKIHLDTLPTIKRELENYKHQLSKTYLSDDKMYASLIEEAYNRLKEEVHVQHILIMPTPGTQPGDTTKSYRTIDSIYHAIADNKADFGATAEAMSDDRGSRPTKGDIGYITALQTVYPFETVAYNTPVGGLSKPFRTQFGYHIIKVLGRRPARGEVSVSQILIATPKSRGSEGIVTARLKADSLKMALRRGASFEELARKFSEDRYTAAEGGKMPRFGVGKMSADFEKAAYDLRKPGDISPIVQTEYGYHIIRLDQKYPLQPLDSMQDYLRKRLENDTRAQLARDMYLERVKSANNFREYPENYNALSRRVTSFPDTGANAGAFSKSQFSDMHAPLFSFAGRSFTQSDMMDYADDLTRGRFYGSREVILRDIYKLYLRTKLEEFEEDQLYKENEAFRNLMDEYRQGIMLFELIDRNVWGKATRDSAGLQRFYSQNQQRYQWAPGFEGTVYRFSNDASRDAAMKLLNAGKTKDEELLKAVNNDQHPDALTIQHGRYEYSKFKDIPASQLVAGKVSAPVKNADGGYVAVYTEKLYPAATPKTLNEAKGYVVADYQDYLEKSWNAQLRQKYPVSVDEATLRSMERN